MEPVIIQSQWSGFRVKSLDVHYVLDVRPEQDWPRGREAYLLSSLWSNLRHSGIAGVLLLGCDVAADPDDYAAISQAATRWPEAVHTGLYKLWPASTRHTQWMWSHRAGRPGLPIAGQDLLTPTAYFSLGFVYVPRRLLNIAFPAGARWKWGEMDIGLSELAWHNNIPIEVCRDAQPKHLHFTEAHNI